MKLGQKVRTPPTGNESHVVVDRVEDPLSGVSGVRVVVVLLLPIALGLHLLQLRDVGQDAQSVVLHSDGDQSQTKSVRFEKGRGPLLRLSRVSTFPRLNKVGRYSEAIKNIK